MPGCSRRAMSFQYSKAGFNSLSRCHGSYFREGAALIRPQVGFEYRASHHAGQLWERRCLISTGETPDKRCREGSIPSFCTMGCKHCWRCSRLLIFREGFDSPAAHHLCSRRIAADYTRLLIGKTLVRIQPRAPCPRSSAQRAIGFYPKGRRLESCRGLQ